MPPHDGSRLTTEQIAYLRHYAGALRNAPDPAATRIARSAAVSAAARYRQTGVSWQALAVILGTTEDELLQWRAAAVPVPAARIRHPRRHQNRSPAEDVVCFLAGNGEVNGNRFDREAAKIRGTLEVRHIRFEHTPCVEIQEIPKIIDSRRPSIAHIAAHAELGQIYLSHHGEPMPVTTTAVRKAIRSAIFVPPLTILSICDSLMLAHALHQEGHTVIGWPGPASDAQCELFVDQLYRAMASPQDVHQAFSRATMFLVAKYVRLHPPVLLG